MRIFLDENLPPRLANGLNILDDPKISGFEVFSIKEIFGIKDENGKSVPLKDEDWIPKVGDMNAAVITQDFNIHRIQSQNELYKQHRIGPFILSPPKGKGYQYWDMVKILVDEWLEIKQIASKENRPFAYIHKPRSGFKRLQEG
jgi:hypothetical protein